METPVIAQAEEPCGHGVRGSGDGPMLAGDIGSRAGPKGRGRGQVARWHREQQRIGLVLGEPRLGPLRQGRQLAPHQ